VVGILNDLSVLTAENAAKAGVVGARAERKAVEIKNEARARGLVLLQVRGSEKANQGGHSGGSRHTYFPVNH